METLDQTNNKQVSDQAIRNLATSSTWIIITSVLGILAGVYLLYTAFEQMSHAPVNDKGAIAIMISLVYLALHLIGLTYGIALARLRYFTTEDFDNASSKHVSYWIFCGIVNLIWFAVIMYFQLQK